MSIRGGATANANVQRIEWSAVVLNADGTVKEDLGQIACHDKDKWKLFKWYLNHPKQLRHWFKMRCKALWSKIWTINR